MQEVLDLAQINASVQYKHLNKLIECGPTK